MNERFFQYIRFKKMTQRELSELSGIPGSTVSRFFQGYPIGSDKLLRLLQVCDDLSLEWLFYNTGDMIRNDTGNVTYNLGQYAGADLTEDNSVNVNGAKGVNVSRPSDLVALQEILQEKDRLIAEKDRIISRRDDTIFRLQSMLPGK